MLRLFSRNSYFNLRNAVFSRNYSPFSKTTPTKIDRSIFYESRRFKGHSHWQNVAKTKGKNDLMRSQTTNRLVTKIVRCIWRTKEPNPKFNKELSNLIEECQANNVPGDTVKRAIERGVKTPPAQTHAFNIVGRSGIYLVAEVETANKRHANGIIYKICAKLKDFGLVDSSQGQLEGFYETGIVKVFKDPNDAKTQDSDADDASNDANAKKTPAPVLNLSEAENLAIEMDCEEVREMEAREETPALFEFTIDPANIDRVASALRVRGYVVLSSDAVYFPNALVKVTPQLEQSVKNLYKALEEVEGIGRIFDNVDWGDEE